MERQVLAGGDPGNVEPLFVGRSMTGHQARVDAGVAFVKRWLAVVSEEVAGGCIGLHGAKRVVSRMPVTDSVKSLEGLLQTNGCNDRARRHPLDLLRGRGSTTPSGVVDDLERTGGRDTFLVGRPWEAIVDPSVANDLPISVQQQWIHRQGEDDNRTREDFVEINGVLAWVRPIKQREVEMPAGVARLVHNLAKADAVIVDGDGEHVTHVEKRRTFMPNGSPPAAW
jgi:hypothetical protein